MRKVIPPEPEEDSTRLRTFFATAPIVAQLENSNVRELRWLERVTVREIYSAGDWKLVCFIP